MTVIESVREYIRTFPGVSGERLNVDFLPEEAQSYSVDVIPSAETIKRYVDGSSIRQFLFVFASRTYYGPEIRQQIDNIGLFESFSRWLDTNTQKGIFPLLDGGREPRKIEVTTSGYAFSPGEDTARYQIQCRLEYFQPA